jgi:hypothetical protein
MLQAFAQLYTSQDSHFQGLVIIKPPSGFSSKAFSLHATTQGGFSQPGHIIITGRLAGLLFFINTAVRLAEVTPNNSFEQAKTQL